MGVLPLNLVVLPSDLEGLLRMEACPWKQEAFQGLEDQALNLGASCLAAHLPCYLEDHP